MKSRKMEGKSNAQAQPRDRRRRPGRADGTGCLGHRCGRRRGGQLGAQNQAGSEEDDFAACLKEAEEPEDVTACLDVVLGELEEVSNGRDFGQDINSPLG